MSDRGSIGALLNAAEKLQSAIEALRPVARSGSELEPALSSLYASFNAVVIELMRHHLTEVKVQLDPKTGSWAGKHTVLCVSYGRITIRIRLQGILDLAPEVAEKVRNTMNVNLKSTYKFVLGFAFDAVSPPKYRSAEEILQHMRYLLDLRQNQIERWGYTQLTFDFESIIAFLQRPDALGIATVVAEVAPRKLGFTLHETADVGTLRKGYVYTESQEWQSLVSRYGATDELKLKTFRWATDQSMPIFREIHGFSRNGSESHRVFFNEPMPEHTFKVSTDDYTFALVDAAGHLIGVVDIIPNTNGDAVHFSSADESMQDNWNNAGMPQYLQEFGKPAPNRYYQSKNVFMIFD